MKMHPPALINKQVTEDMLHWIMMQPNTVTMNVTTNEFNITPAKGAQDFPITLTLRHVMVHELMAILAFNGFESELSEDQLKVSKGLWSMEVESILQLMPFPDYLPYQIKKAYEHHEYESRDAEYGNANYPSRERLESIRQFVIDNTEGGL